MDGSGQDTVFALPGDYRTGKILSHRESRLVLRATRVDDDSLRILKCLVPPFPPEEEEAFRHEFLLLDALRHPCWVRPLRFGSLPNGGCFLEMEEAPGVTLSRWPVRGWWPETLAVAHQVLSGLEVLHRLGYAHLDLGPEQLLVASTEEPAAWGAEAAGASTRVRLLDLGLAAPFGAAIGARGTPGSIAPELLQARTDWDARSDLYAVGTILFELFTGQAAFPGRTVREVLVRQLEGPEPDPGEEAGLPPPVRDLVRELLARDPAARPRSALETWQRLREQAPRAGVGTLPPFLVAGEEFAFIGRDAEIAAFEAWLSKLDSATAAERFELSGEEGIGCRRLAARLGAVAESRGWARGGDVAARVLHHSGGGTVQIGLGSRADASLRVESTRADRGGVTSGLALEPMPAGDLVGILAAAGFESDILRRRLAAACLGSPGLLAGLIRVLPREVDFATRHAGEDRLDATLDQLTVPAPWLDWSRRLLGELSPADSSALLCAGVSGLPGMPAGVALGPSVLPAALDPLTRRGLLYSAEGRWRARYGLWARAIVGADEKQTAAIGRELFGSLDQPEDDVARARLGLILRDSNAVAAALPGALNSLAARGRREEAVLLHAEASRLGPAALRGLGEQEIIGLLEGVFGLGTRSGSLLNEPGDPAAVELTGEVDPERLGIAAANALLDVWAWMGRQHRDTAEVALVAAEHVLARRSDRSAVLPFLADWFRYRLLDVEENAEASRAALRRLRGRLESSESRRHAWCDVSEAAILSREGRYEEALRLLTVGMTRLAALEDGEQAAFLSQVANIHLRRGENHRASETLAQSEMALRRAGFTVNRLVVANHIGGVAFGDGDLPRAQAWNEDLLREEAARGHWNDAANALGNLSLILLERGRLGEATRAVGDAAALATHATRPLTARRLASRRIHLLVQCGLWERAEEEAGRFFPAWEATSPAAALFVRVSLGESFYGQGRLEAGCTEFRRAVTGFLDTGSADDAADTLARWGLAETASGRIAEGRAHLAELEPVRPQSTGLTRSAIALLEAETGLGPAAGQAAGDVLNAAERAVRVLEAQDRWSLAWRAHWCLARASKAEGRARQALAAYESARVILITMVESLGAVARTDGLLNLPAVRSFLKDLQ